MRRSSSDVSVATWLIPVVTGTKPPLLCALSLARPADADRTPGERGKSVAVGIRAGQADRHGRDCRAAGRRADPRAGGAGRAGRGRPGGAPPRPRTTGD